MDKKAGLNMAAQERREQVAEDLVTLFSTEATETDAQRIKQWRTGTKEYQQEFMETAHILGGLDALANDQDILSLLHQPGKVESKTSRILPALAVAATLLMAVGIGLVSWFATDPAQVGDRYVTRVGEQKTINLDDGSVLTLNTNTQVLVNIDENNRLVKLLKGEAYFDVFSDANRPFAVDLGEQSVTVLGTEFNIYRQPEKFTLAVTEGLVSLHATGEAASNNAPEITVETDTPDNLGVIDQRKISAGTVAAFDVSSQHLTVHQPKAMDHLANWRTGMIRFDEQPLAKVVEELNRYSAKQIIIDDESIADLNIYVIVKLDAIDQTLTGLEYSLPIKVVREFDKVLIQKSDSK